MPETGSTPPAGPTLPSVAWRLFGALFLLTLLVYWPALSGGYLFDDSYYIQNPDVLVTTLRPSDWARAALSQVGTNQFRALSMISFAANYYLTGPDPWWFKFTNVCIHLLNGLLLFQVLRQLFGLHADALSARGRPAGESAGRPELFAAFLAGLWLVAPINLTGVAYISQRIESLATAFVFLGLIGYLRVRRRQFESGTSPHRGWIILLACMIAGMTAKESAAVLPAYVFCIELAITGFRNRDGRWCTPAVWTQVVFLVLPMIAGLIWISRWDFASITQFREFTIGERLLTEPRVLVDYIGWTLAPNLDTLTFYHDDLGVSHGLLSPPSTLAAIVALAALLAVALWQRARRPLFCLGILWFFAGHAMTATIIPLELVFEHRNYFASVGLLLAVASLSADWRGDAAARWLPVAGVVVLAWFAGTTFLRSLEWSDPLRLAHAEAAKRPGSMRAQYGLAQILIVMAGKDARSPLLSQARTVLDRIVFRPDSGIGPPQALIYIDGIQHRPVDPALWDSIQRKLKAGPVTETDVASLIFIYRCMQHRDCAQDQPHMLAVFQTAAEPANAHPNILSTFADFAFLEMHDPDLALRLERDSIQRAPRTPTFRANLATMLMASGHLQEAGDEIARLKTMNRFGSLDAMIADLQRKLEAIRRRQDMQPDVPLAPAPPASTPTPP